MTTEFNSNINFGAIQPQNTAKSVEKTQIPAVNTNETASNTNDGVPVGQTSVAGKSQIKADNIANDLATFCANPKTIELADEVFNQAYASLVAENDPEAYEKACLMASEFVNECVR